MSGTPDCSGDAAAYALGALEPHETEAFLAHMQECAVCRDEVEALGGVVQSLAMATHQYEAPRELKRRLMREVRRAPAPARPVLTSALPRRAWGSPRRLVASLTAVAVAAGGVVAGLELTAGAAVTVISAQVTRIAGSAQLRVSNGHAELVVNHLTPPGHGHTYEVWLKSGNAAPVPAGSLFGVNSSGYADVGIPRRIRGVSAVMVTQEPLKGSPAPTTSPVIVARID